ncbi:MAG TPA: M67 family metallopeptidase [Acidimicrobiia bacterium]|jgi:proteasome lid subunit RPN8/RPN11|nr:M67 family metallopeptidase [Acidimicrobiia bacterium]
MTTPAPRPDTSSAPDRLAIPAQIHDAIVVHALVCQPFEACGLLASDPNGRLRMAYALDNAVREPDRFTIEPDQHFGALRHAERHGWEIGGVFHSHPTSGPQMSATDLAQPHESGWIHVIVGFVPRLSLGVWRVANGEPRPVAWSVS